MEIYIYIYIHFFFFLNKAVPMGISGNQIDLFFWDFPHTVPCLHSQCKVPIPLCLIMALLYNPTTLGFFFLTIREIIP